MKLRISNDWRGILVFLSLLQLPEPAVNWCCCRLLCSKYCFCLWGSKQKKKLKGVSTKCLQHHQCDYTVAAEQRDKSLHTSSSQMCATECPKKKQEIKITSQNKSSKTSVTVFIRKGRKQKCHLQRLLSASILPSIEAFLATICTTSQVYIEIKISTVTIVTQSSTQRFRN